MDILRMIVAAFFAFLIAKAVGAAVDPVQRPDGSAGRTRDARRLMVPCATCGVYVLGERAIRPPGRATYCSAECSLVSASRT